MMKVDAKELGLEEECIKQPFHNAVSILGHCTQMGFYSSVIPIAFITEQILREAIRLYLKVKR